MALLDLDTYSNVRKYLGGEYQRSDVDVSELLVSTPTANVVTVTHNDLAFEIETGGITPDMTADWEKMLGAAEKFVNQEGALNNAKIKRARFEALFAVGIAAGLPILVLILGTSLFWALRGFRGSRT